MNMNFMNFKISNQVLIGISVFMFLALCVGWVWWFVAKQNQNPVVSPQPTQSALSLFPYFSIDYSTVGKSNEWILKNFQPKLIDFESKNGSNYLIAEYTDSENRERQVKIFVTGQTPSSKDIDKVFLFFGGEPGNGEWLTFEQLKNKLIKGKQVRIEYLTFSGPTYNRTTCQKYLNFCALASILESQKLGNKLEDILKNGKTDWLVVPANIISLQLYEK